MPAQKRELCRDGTPHVSDGGVAYDSNEWAEVQHSWCRICRQPLTRFWIDGEPGERAAGWSSWASKPYIIEEIGVP